MKVNNENLKRKYKNLARYYNCWSQEFDKRKIRVVSEKE
jgi:hypothetical protein